MTIDGKTESPVKESPTDPPNFSVDLSDRLTNLLLDTKAASASAGAGADRDGLNGLVIFDPRAGKEEVQLAQGPGPGAEDIARIKGEKPATPEKPELQSHYNYKETQKAVDDAIAAGVPMVVRIGANWCGPCLGMEGQTVKKGHENDYDSVLADSKDKDKAFWPKFEAAEKGNLVPLKVNIEHANSEAGSALEKALVGKNGDYDKVEGFPTARVVIPSKDANGKYSFKVVGEFSGSDMISKNLGPTLEPYRKAKP